MNHQKSLLEVKNLHAFYDQQMVLKGVDFQINSGEIVTLLGRNGSGRSTLAKSMMGLIRWSGEIRFLDELLYDYPTYQIANLGISYTPENKQIFSQLTVHENLILGQKNKFSNKNKNKSNNENNTSLLNNHKIWSFDDIYNLFPHLKNRQFVQAGLLSGGEQQMLALSRSLMGNPSLMIIDEPTEGLAPQWVQLLKKCFLELKKNGLSILLIEQKLTLALDISDRILIMNNGKIVFDGQSFLLKENPSLYEDWLTI